MFRMLVLQSLYNLSDERVEYQGRGVGAPIDDDHLFQFDGDHPFRTIATGRRKVWRAVTGTVG